MSWFLRVRSCSSVSEELQYDVQLFFLDMINSYCVILRIACHVLNSVYCSDIRSQFAFSVVSRFKSSIVTALMLSFFGFIVSVELWWRCYEFHNSKQFSICRSATTLLIKQLEGHLTWKNLMSQQSSEVFLVWTWPDMEWFQKDGSVKQIAEAVEAVTADWTGWDVLYSVFVLV